MRTLGIVASAILLVCLSTSTGSAQMPDIDPEALAAGNAYTACLTQAIDAAYDESVNPGELATRVMFSCEVEYRAYKAFVDRQLEGKVFSESERERIKDSRHENDMRKVAVHGGLWAWAIRRCRAGQTVPNFDCTNVLRMYAPRAPKAP
jgi:hypothetical protein